MGVFRWFPFILYDIKKKDKLILFMTRTSSLFGTDGVRGPSDHYPLRPQDFFTWGYALGQAISIPSVICLAQDGRPSGTLSANLLRQGLECHGHQVQDYHIFPTPALALATRHHKAAMGIMISASHNLAQDNGIKIFNTQGEKWQDTSTIEDLFHAAHAQPRVCPAPKSYTFVSGASLYHTFLEKTLPSLTLPSLGTTHKTLVIDAAHGAMTPYARHPFATLGFNVILLQESAYNGAHINKNCGVMNLNPLKHAVQDTQAFLGIAFDGDGDRVLFVQSDGTVCNGDQVLALLAPLYRSSVVGTILSNGALPLYLQRQGLAFHRAPVGDTAVYQCMQNTQSALGGEPSGHILLPHHTTGDGLLTALHVVTTLELSPTPWPCFVPFPQKMVSVRYKNIQAFYSPPVQQDVHHAITEFSPGRATIRPSGTEPVIRITAEAPQPDVLDPWIHRVQHMLRSHDVV